ncbi:CGNR zinc finger domain-containing protein [Kocuria flava]|uniref:CGNR zinc finger domain-containing protein n=1 Tax=Kocuria flava TaxID=446860 RepID=UPI003F1DADE4
MHFAYDVEDMLEFVLALLNTAPGASSSGEDELTTVQELQDLLAEHRFSGRSDGTAEELAEIRALRQELRQLWVLDREPMVEAVNALLASEDLAPRLARHDGLDWHLHAAAPDAPLAVRLHLETAVALVEVIRAGETDRLRVCEAGDCDGALLDLSRNRSKRFCGARCANRTNVAAYRRRRGTGEEPGRGGGAASA